MPVSARNDRRVIPGQLLGGLDESLGIMRRASLAARLKGGFAAGSADRCSKRFYL
jgi:hypothetical protein